MLKEVESGTHYGLNWAIVQDGVTPGDVRLQISLRMPQRGESRGFIPEMCADGELDYEHIISVVCPTGSNGKQIRAIEAYLLPATYRFIISEGQMIHRYVVTVTDEGKVEITAKMV